MGKLCSAVRWHNDNGLLSRRQCRFEVGGMDAQSKVLCMVLMAASGRWLNENNSGLSDLTHWQNVLI